MMEETNIFAYTSLSEDDIDIIQSATDFLPLMAELTGGDMFIDCITSDGKAVVVAQSRPNSVQSLYQSSIVGQYALRENEPAVFYTLENQVSVRDIKAITQENCKVRQAVTPILGKEGRCIAALICEREISFRLMQEKKLQRLEEAYAQKDPEFRFSTLPRGDNVAIREVHHRVKNSLQIVASILNLQTRQCSDLATKKILQENVTRVLSIATIHDILTAKDTNYEQIDSLALLEKLKQNLGLFVPDGKKIIISICGDSKKLEADVATSVSLVVNELITNALKHAFVGRKEGNISVSFRSGTLGDTLTVTDDGVGFDMEEIRKGSLGMRLVDMVVRDKLHGKLTLHSDQNGSSIHFTF